MVLVVVVVVLAAGLVPQKGFCRKLEAGAGAGAGAEAEGHSHFNSDKIEKLPGQPQISFLHYSGYITVDSLKQRALFYYFAESEIDPASKPLVLWLNGGPGCSSVGVGAFSENGPFRPSGHVLVRNEYSWNKDDKMTARDNLVFLQNWFAKFPQYKDRDLYITGESYAGHYVPQLAQLMVEFNKKGKFFNLKGIALGNPVLEFSTDFNSRAEFSGCIACAAHGVTKWAVCSSVLEYELLNLQIPTIAVVGSLIKSGVPVMIYRYRKLEHESRNFLKLDFSFFIQFRLFLSLQRDQDSVIPLTGSRSLVQRLASELGLKTSVPYRVWFEGKQVNLPTNLSFESLRPNDFVGVVCMNLVLKMGGL
uniref:Carboxypeptidase n=1 Tax=Ananas comosus var. bracteatus TaxID=296719 RepID=A0A6V7Q160_ANACO|nr:unnamed protein product [Ananas comosus var. bracteatus]